VLLGSWGLSAECAADLNGDGQVGIVDFLILVAWRQAWGDRDLDDRCDEIIPQDVMAAFFRDEYERERPHPGLGLEILARADADFEAGRGVPLSEAFSVR
jgi:hypothetical protein